MRGPGFGKKLKSQAEEVRNEAASVEAEPDAPVPGFTGKRVPRVKRPRGPKRSGIANEKVYLGVRVKMPVRDMLKNIRISQGWGPQELQDTFKKKEERVKTRTGCKAAKRRSPTKSLEELAIIVEVLEEDLKINTTHGSSHQSSQSSPPASPVWSPGITGYNSDGSEDMIPSPQTYMSYSPRADYHQAMSPDYMPCTSPASSPEELHSLQNWGMDSSAFFWIQLQKEEMVLNNICDAELLATDELGQNLLHKVVRVGKRALACAVAKRMAAINSLDLKDNDGMTALLYAAKYNHHLMVTDLINLGASINEKNNDGKSCLHLSAEKGYIQVLEVLKQLMMDGFFVDVEATDNSGMSVLQCASVALKTTVGELASSRSPLCTRLNSLLKAQMLETLECLLQMGSYLHSTGCHHA